MDDQELKPAIEALLMSSSSPLTIEAMQSAFEEWQRPTTEAISRVLAILMEEYANRGVALKALASGYRFQTQPHYAPLVARLLSDKPPKYSQAFLETLAIIAYKQPVTRADIEDVRGVASSSAIMKTMMERGWIRVSGYRDVPGKPAVYSTTKAFLDYFNLSSLADLPCLEKTDDQ